MEFDKTIRELKYVGAKIEEKTLVCQLLLSLPESYEALITALETIEPEQLTVSKVKSRLLDEESKRKGIEEYDTKV